MKISILLLATLSVAVYAAPKWPTGPLEKDEQLSAYGPTSISGRPGDARSFGIGSGSGSGLRGGTKERTVTGARAAANNPVVVLADKEVDVAEKAVVASGTSSQRPSGSGSGRAISGSGSGSARSISITGSGSGSIRGFSGSGSASGRYFSGNGSGSVSAAVGRVNPGLAGVDAMMLV